MVRPGYMTWLEFKAKHPMEALEFLKYSENLIGFGPCSEFTFAELCSSLDMEERYGLAVYCTFEAILSTDYAGEIEPATLWLPEKKAWFCVEDLYEQYGLTEADYR